MFPKADKEYRNAIPNGKNITNNSLAWKMGAQGEILPWFFYRSQAVQYFKSSFTQLQNKELP